MATRKDPTSNALLFRHKRLKSQRLHFGAHVIDLDENGQFHTAKTVKEIMGDQDFVRRCAASPNVATIPVGKPAKKAAPKVASKRSKKAETPESAE